MPRAIARRAAAAPVALPLGHDESRLSSSRRRGSSLRGLLRFDGTRHLELNKLPTSNNTKNLETSPERLLVESILRISPQTPVSPW